MLINMGLDFLFLSEVHSVFKGLRRTHVRVAVAKCGLLFASLLLPMASAWALAEKGSEIVIYGVPPSGYTEGGEGSLSVSHTATWDAGSPFAPWNPQSVTASALAEAETGTLGASIHGTGTVSCTGACSAGTPGASARVTLWDTFTIGPGGDFEEGDAAKIRNVLSLEGSYFLTGSPSAGSDWWYDVRLSTQQVGYQDLYHLFEQSPPLSPPANSTVGPLSWNPVLDVEVGDKVYLWAQLVIQLGGTGLSNDGSSGWPNGTYTNFLDFLGTGKAGLGYAPGYEAISITSAAGAPIAAVPEPQIVLLLGLGLAMLGAKRFGKKR